MSVLAVLHPSGEWSLPEVPDGPVSLATTQELVGGLVEVVGTILEHALPEGVEMLMNEEGLLIGLEENVFVPEWTGHTNFGAGFRGPLAFVRFDLETGNHLPLTEGDVEFLRRREIELAALR